MAVGPPASGQDAPPPAPVGVTAVLAGTGASQVLAFDGEDPITFSERETAERGAQVARVGAAGLGVEADDAPGYARWVAWQPSRGVEIARYEIWRNNTEYDHVPGNETTFLDEAPVSGAAYRIRAVSASGNVSDWSAAASMPVLAVDGAEVDAVAEEAEAAAPAPPEPDASAEQGTVRGRLATHIEAWIDHVFGWWAASA